MLKGLYTSALGLAVQNRRQEVAANNLANSNTIGFKKEAVIASSFPDMLIQRLNDPASQEGKAPVVGKLSMGVRLDEVVTDYSRGILRESTNPLEMALRSDGYFVVATPMGERYTRSGEFKVDTEGRLVTSDGYPVLGQNGEMTLASGDIKVSEEGVISSGGKEIDKLRIVNFNSTIIKEGSSLFQGEDPQDVENPLVAQGFVEGSNANSLEEMIGMISVNRAYESNQKLIQIQDSTLDKAVNEVGRV